MITTTISNSIRVKPLLAAFIGVPWCENEANSRSYRFTLHLPRWVFSSTAEAGGEKGGDR
jgi:hypothetical protein